MVVLFSLNANAFQNNFKLYIISLIFCENTWAHQIINNDLTDNYYTKNMNKQISKCKKEGENG